MGAILASTTIGRAQTTLLDEAATPGGTGTTWNLPTAPGELLDYYNASVRTIGLYVPSAITVTQPTALVAGPRQTTAGTFIAVRSNAAGRGVTQVDMDDMDHTLPNWRATTPGATEHWMADRKDAGTYWVYPPGVAAALVELTQILAPAAVALTDPNPIDDEYEPVIYWLVLAYAYAKNAKRGDLQKSAAYLARAAQALGINDAEQLKLQPMPVLQEQANNG